MARAFKVLAKDGQLSSGAQGNLQLYYLARPYAPGTAGAQANQIFQLFPLLKLTVREKGVMKPNPNSVLLMTILSKMGLALWMQWPRAPLSRLPEIHRLYGVVGHCSGRPLHLIKAERLEKLQPGTPQRRLALKLQKLQRAVNGKAASEDVRRQAELTCAYMAEQLPDQQWAKTFQALAEFAAGKHELGCDFHSGNFMVRPTTGDLVLNDPFMSRLI